jgi:hypothetical protein
MTKMNWHRVEKENRDRHAIQQGHAYPENLNRRSEADEAARSVPLGREPAANLKRSNSASFTIANLKRRIAELERQLLAAMRS